MGNNEKDSRLATSSPRYNMYSWSFLPLLSSNFPILLARGVPFRSEAYPGSSARSISDSLWRVHSVHRKVEASYMVLAGSHNYCYRSITLGLPLFKLLFWSVSLLGRRRNQAESVRIKIVR